METKKRVSGLPNARMSALPVPVRAPAHRQGVPVTHETLVPEAPGTCLPLTCLVAAKAVVP